MLGHWLIPLFVANAVDPEPEPEQPPKTGGALRRRPAWIVPPRNVAMDDDSVKRRRNAAVLFSVILS